MISVHSICCQAMKWSNVRYLIMLFVYQNCLNYLNIGTVHILIHFKETSVNIILLCIKKVIVAVFTLARLKKLLAKWSNMEIIKMRNQ